jgi:hypothetical protein
MIITKLFFRVRTAQNNNYVVNNRQENKRFWRLVRPFLTVAKIKIEINNCHNSSGGQKCGHGQKRGHGPRFFEPLRNVNFQTFWNLLQSIAT